MPDVRTRAPGNRCRCGSGRRAGLRRLTDLVLPYATGNVHPRFWGWVHGNGTAVGMLAEMLAATMNANAAAATTPVYVERQVIDW